MLDQNFAQYFEFTDRANGDLHNKLSLARGAISVRQFGQFYSLGSSEVLKQSRYLLISIKVFKRLYRYYRVYLVKTSRGIYCAISNGQVQHFTSGQCQVVT